MLWWVRQRQPRWALGLLGLDPLQLLHALRNPSLSAIKRALGLGQHPKSNDAEQKEPRIAKYHFLLIYSLFGKGGVYLLVHSLHRNSKEDKLPLSQATTLQTPLPLVLLLSGATESRDCRQHWKHKELAALGEMQVTSVRSLGPWNFSFQSATQRIGGLMCQYQHRYLMFNHSKPSHSTRTLLFPARGPSEFNFSPLTCPWLPYRSFPSRYSCPEYCLRCCCPRRVQCWRFSVPWGPFGLTDLSCPQKRLFSANNTQCLQL